MEDRCRVTLVKSSSYRPSGMYAWEWVHAHSQFEVTVVVSDPTPYADEDTRLPVVKLPMSDQQIALGSMTATWVLRKARFPTAYLRGLPGCLKASDIVITVEDTSLYSLTCALHKLHYRLAVLTDESIQCPGYTRSWAMRRVRRYVRDRADVFFPCTLMGTRVLIHDGIPPDKIVVIPYATPEDLFHPAPKAPAALGLPERLASGFVVLFVGRISVAKGVPWLLEAARKLAPLYPDLYFVFAGRDDMTGSSFRAFLKTFPDQAFWLRPTAHAKMNIVYNLCDVFVLPSIPTVNWEDHCATVLYEALACGKPVVASHTGGSPYVLSPRCSILVEFMSGDALAEAISVLYHDRDQLVQMSEQALQHYRRSYSPEVVGKRIVHELERLVHGSGE